MPAPVKLSARKDNTTKLGRPCLLTPSREAALLNAIEEGMPLKQAAMLAGISYDTLNRWRTRGNSEFAPDEFRKFCKALERAEAVAMQVNLARVRAAGEKDWRAAAWILERRHPEEFGTQRDERAKADSTPPWEREGAEQIEVFQRMKKQAGVRELAGMLGGILMRNRQRKMDEEHAARMKRARLRE